MQILLSDTAFRNQKHYLHNYVAKIRSRNFYYGWLAAPGVNSVLFYLYLFLITVYTYYVACAFISICINLFVCYINIGPAVQRLLFNATVSTCWYESLSGEYFFHQHWVESVYSP